LFSEYWSEYVKSHELFKSYFLGDKPFVTGNNKMSIADLLAVVTLEHAKNIDADLIDSDADIAGYIERCRAMLPDYDVIHEDVRNLKTNMKKWNLL
jgi:hypothetical protein